MCPNFDLSILGYVNVKVLQIVYRFAVAEGELRRPAAVEDGCGVCSVISQRYVS